jgi:small-conductance mechanosensitive channel
MAPMTPGTLSRALVLAAAAAFLVVPAPSLAAGPLDLLPSSSPDAKAPAAKLAAAQEPTAIPLPRVGPAAVDAYRSLAAIRARTDPEAVLDATLAPLDEVAASVERAGAQFTRQPMAMVSDRDLVDFRQEMMRQDAQLGRWSGKIEDSVRSTYGSQKELERMGAVWKLTEEHAAAEGAAPAIVDRARTVRKESEDLQRQVKVRLDRLLAAQDRVASLRIGILGWLSAADRADAVREQQLFEIEAKPIWAIFSSRERGRDFGGQLERVFQHNASAIQAFVREEGDAFLWVVAIFVLVVVLVAWAGRRFARRAKEDPELTAPVEVLSHPISAGILVALSLTGWLLPRAPMAFAQMAVLLMLPPFLLLARKLLAAELRAPLYGFTALFAVARLGEVLPEYSLAGRLLTFLVSAVGMLGAIRLLRKDAPWTRAIVRPRRTWHVVLALGLLACLLGIALAANVVGNVSMARRLSDGSLTSGMMALLLAAVMRVLRALLAGALRMPEIHRIRSLADHGDAIVARGSSLIEFAAVLLWAYGTMRAFRIDGAVMDWLIGAFTSRLRFGGLDVSLGDLGAFAVTLWLAVLLARLLRLVLESRLEKDSRLPAGVPIAISKTVGYLVVGMGFLVAVLASGMDVTRFTVILGTLSVGIGFGLQNVVNNFVSGLILLYERPIRVGDVIEVGTSTGTVTHIGIRSSTIKTFDGAEVVLPNSNLVSNQLTNWTLSDRARRILIDVGVAYGSDVAKVQEILLLAARASVDVLSDPAPVTLFTGTGDSALNFQLRFWTAHFDRYLSITSMVRTDIVEKLGAAGISIPFPQQDLHVVSVEAAAVRALRGENPTGK